MELDRLFAWVETLIDRDFTAPLYDDLQARATLAAAGRSAADHQRFLQRWNGGYALGGKLHLFGARAEPPNQSLDAWNRADGWRQAFGVVIEGVTFFAESAFGDQFGYRDGKVVWFHARLGRVERLAPGFVECLEAILLDPGRYVEGELFDACVARHGALPRGGHFALTGPQSYGAPLQAAAMSVMPARDNLEMLAVAASMLTPPPTMRRAR